MSKVVNLSLHMQEGQEGQEGQREVQILHPASLHPPNGLIQAKTGNVSTQSTHELTWILSPVG